MFYDIETSLQVHLHWGAGYQQDLNYKSIVKERQIICVCWKWEGEKKVHSLDWGKGCDKKLLQRFIKEMNRATELVAHNGDRFDLKWIRTRALFHGIDMRHKYDTVDTLKEAKKYFRFNSNGLDYITRLLNVGGKIETGGWEAWEQITLYNDKKHLKQMIKYCKNDCVILEKVFNKLKKYTEPKIHRAALVDNERWTCPDCGNEHLAIQKERVTKTGVLRYDVKCKNDNCERQYTQNTTQYKQMILWRNSQQSLPVNTKTCLK